MGNLAPFHSHMQKRKTTKAPQQSGANIIAESHGKVMPPYEIICVSCYSIYVF